MSPATTLIVDNSRIVRNVLPIPLRLAGFEVEVAADAESGLALLAKKPCNLLIVAWRLEGMTAARAIVAAREAVTPASLPVIALTMPDDWAGRAEARDAGAGAVLDKPVDPSMLQFWAKRLTGTATRAKPTAPGIARPTKAPPTAFAAPAR